MYHSIIFIVFCVPSCSIMKWILIRPMPKPCTKCFTGCIQTCSAHMLNVIPSDWNPRFSRLILGGSCPCPPTCDSSWRLRVGQDPQKVPTFPKKSSSTC